MKTRPPTHSHHSFTLIAAVAVAALCPWRVLSAPPIIVDSLSVGTSNTNTVGASSGAVGNNNSSSLTSLAVGSNNSVSASCGFASGAYNFVGGFANIVVGNNNSFTGTGSATFGAINQGVGNYNLMAGFNNRIYGSTTSETAMFGNSNSGTSLYDCLISGSSNVLTGARNSLISGSGNVSTDAISCLASGSGNVLTGATSSAAIGGGLLLSASSVGRVVLGQFNADNETNARFVVGNGTSTTARSNAFVVYQNGTAKVGGQFVVTASTFPTYLGDGSVANIAFSPGPNRSISVNASSTGAGNDLKIQAGNSANGTDLAGGGLILSGGNSTGSAGSSIEFQTAASNTSGTALRTAMTRMKINAAGSIEAGEGLSTLSTIGSPQLVLGKYNNAASETLNGTFIEHGKGLFIIGAGTAATPPNARKNAMRVTEDGTILVQPQGDLIMDPNFQVGPTP